LLFACYLSFVICYLLVICLLLFVIFKPIMPKYTFPFFFLLWLIPISLSADPKDHCVVVLSMDGFRWDYPAIYHTPNLHRLAKAGCRAESLKPAYPTKTFPNHYAIATGLYPDHNGIVQNSFYDPKLDRVFRMGDRKAVQDSIFWEGEAIWETAEKQGVKVASYFWVGTESNERYRPEMRKYYEDSFPIRQQIDTVFKWLMLPSDQRPGLVMFYFDQPDKTSHDFGPVSQEVEEVVERLDQLVGALTKGLKKIEKLNKMEIDLIILSDHGMGYIPEGQQVFLEDIIDLKRIKRYNGGSPVISLEPDPAYLDEVYGKLKSAPHLKVWKRDELPARYHYGSHQRIPQLIVEADSLYGLETRRKENFHYGLGTHGYDPANRDMHGIFYAAGPSFKKGFVQPAFENVNIYELLAKLLKIKPAKTDGSLNLVKGMLKGN
jgi:alkaline phosphatase D